MAVFGNQAPKGRSGTSLGVSITGSTGGSTGGVSDFFLHEITTNVKQEMSKIQKG